MNAKHLLAALTAAALLAPSARAGDLETSLQALAGAKGDEYTAARDALVAKGDGIRSSLEAKLQNARWTESTFPELAAATVVLARIAQPDLTAKISHIEGVDKASYSKRRRPEPECARELKRLGPDAAGLLLELAWKTGDKYPSTTDAERSALRQGVVYALAETKHPAALLVMKKVANDASELEAVRLLAAEGLGTQGSAAALAELVALHDAESTPANVKLAAIRGAARVPTADALAFLEKRLAVADERRQAVVALGGFGSRLGWESRGADAARQGDELRAKATSDLIALVRSSEPGVDDEALCQALATIAHESARTELSKAKDDASLSASSRALAAKALERVNMALDRK